jgi:hypothetical protein
MEDYCHAWFIVSIGSHCAARGVGDLRRVVHAFRMNFDHLLAKSSLSGPSRSTKPSERKARSKARFNDLTTSGSSLLSFSKRLIGISQSPPAIGDYLKKYLMMDVGR